MQSDFAMISTPPADISAGVPRYPANTCPVRAGGTLADRPATRPDDHPTFETSLRDASRCREKSTVREPARNRRAPQSRANQVQGEDRPLKADAADEPRNAGRPVTALQPVREDEPVDGTDRQGWENLVFQPPDDVEKLPSDELDGLLATFIAAASPGSPDSPEQAEGHAIESAEPVDTQKGPAAAADRPDAAVSETKTGMVPQTDKSRADGLASAVDNPVKASSTAADSPLPVPTGEFNPVEGPAKAVASSPPLEEKGSGQASERSQAAAPLHSDSSPVADERDQPAEVKAANRLDKESGPRAHAVPSQEVQASERTTELSAGQQALARSRGESLGQVDLEGRSERLTADDNPQNLTQTNPSAHKDGSALYHQDQGFEHKLETVSANREKEAAPGALRVQPLDQIVEKVVYHLKNGHGEVKIDLKPDFLGQVRLQIATENHQVTVRIFTELPAVKEMIENSLHQLRTELQQQGLKIDGLEVFISSDANRGEKKGEGLGQRRYRPATATEPDEGPGNVAGVGQSTLGRRISGTVDTFA